MSGPAASVDPAVSVVVATHERRALLGRLVAALEAQTWPDLEIVIVDDGSTDGTWDELGRLAAAVTRPVRVLREDRAGGPARARNRGWREARGSIVAFTDDDCVPAPGWVEALVAPIVAGRAELAQGVTEPPREQWEGSGPFARTMWVLDEDGFYATCNMAYRRDVLEEARGFDERFGRPFGEDTDLAWRAIEAGARTAFVDDAVVYHEVWPSSWPAHVRDRVRREAIVLAAREHPQIRARFWRPRWYQGSHPRAVLAAAGGIVAVTVPGWRRLSGAALAVPYVHYRLAVRRLPCRPRNTAPVIALALVADLVEVGVLAAASVRYRSLLL
ncbi:MAG TPA: glycosyltransferase [Acidimicrobiales bacterium]|nr:glycosyltransferase [Acidimicrobiales bacterium]